MTSPSQSYETPGLPGAAQEPMRHGLRMTQRIHLAQVVVAVLFGLIVLAIIRGPVDWSPDEVDAVAIAAGVIAVGSIIFSALVPRMARSITPGEADAGNAVPRYQVVCMMRWVVLDGAVFFAALAALLAQNSQCLEVFGVSVAFLAYYWPSQRELTRLFLRQRN